MVQSSLWVTPKRMLDFDYLSAKLAHNGGAVRRRDEGGHIDHPNAIQG